MSTVTYIQDKHGDTLVYRALAGKGPGIIYLHGFMSDMQATKALYVEQLCRKWGYAFLRFDYFGHGASSGDFMEGTIGKWQENVLFMLDTLTQGPQILIGSSMGAWLMLLATIARKSRVAGILGIAAAPDFTQKLIYDKLTKADLEKLEAQNFLQAPLSEGEPYAFSKKLLIEARQHCLLDNPIAIDCPIRLLHGIQDTDVPWEFSQLILERSRSTNVHLSLIKNGNHRLSTKSDLQLLAYNLKSLIKTVKI